MIQLPLVVSCFYGVFHLPRSFSKNLIFISHDAFPHKILPLSPKNLLCLTDLYLPSIRWISNPSKLIQNHIQKLYHERFISIQFLLGFRKNILSLGAPPSKWFILLTYLITHLFFILHITQLSSAQVDNILAQKVGYHTQL